ncbi:hypothetical protein KAU11_05310 [Candidatus Babeliales bacterium]|nr:hypothetical protein [Candidatus Babeliales bacterium]
MTEYNFDLFLKEALGYIKQTLKKRGLHGLEYDDKKLKEGILDAIATWFSQEQDFYSMLDSYVINPLVQYLRTIPPPDSMTGKIELKKGAPPAGVGEEGFYWKSRQLKNFWS